MADTPDGETPQEPLTPASGAQAPSTPSVPPVDNTPAAADVEAQKALEKAQLEINMLRNKVDAANKELEAKTKKELEEKEDYRSLAEQAQAKADALQKEKDDAETKASTEAATADVYKDFPTNVIEVAKTAGLTALGDSEEAKTVLKTKLEAIAKNVGSSAPVIQGSNPAPSSAPEIDGKALTKQMHFDDREVRENAIKQAVGSHPQVQAFRDFAKKANNLEPQAS